jgi:hypothetical protein
MGLLPIVSPLAVRADKTEVQCQLDRVLLLIVEKTRMKMNKLLEAWWILEIKNGLRLSSCDMVLHKPSQERATNKQL